MSLRHHHYTLANAATRIIRRYRRRLPYILTWLGVITVFYTGISLLNLSTGEIIQSVYTVATMTWWGPLIFFATYLIRPLLFIPVTLFAFASGLFFGFWGLPIAFGGAIASAIVAHAVGRWIRRTHEPPEHMTPRNRAERLLAHHPFETVLGLHLTLLPFDMVNYTSGLLRVHTLSFIGGVALGIIPGVISMVSLGVGIDLDRLFTDGLSIEIIDWRYIILAAVIFVGANLGTLLYRRYRPR